MPTYAETARKKAQSAPSGAANTRHGRYTGANQPKRNPLPEKRTAGKTPDRPHSTTSTKDRAVKRAEIRRDAAVAGGKKFLKNVGSGIAENFAKLKEAVPGFIAERNKRFGENVSAIGKTIQSEVDKARVKHEAGASTLDTAAKPAVAREDSTGRGPGGSVAAKPAVRSPAPVNKSTLAAKPKRATAAPVKVKTVSSGDASNRLMPGHVYVGKNAAPLPQSEVRASATTSEPKKAVATNGYHPPKPAGRPKQEGVGAWRARTTAGRERDRRN